MTCKNALVVFDEIPPRQAPRSQRFYIFNFAAFFAVDAVFSMIIWWFRWPHPLSLSDKIAIGSFALYSLISGVFLLTAKSAAPRTNQGRLWVLFNTGMIVPMILEVLSSGLR
jgi:hypothetical protein